MRGRNLGAYELAATETVDIQTVPRTDRAAASSKMVYRRVCIREGGQSSRRWPTENLEHLRDSWPSSGAGRRSLLALGHGFGVRQFSRNRGQIHPVASSHGEGPFGHGKELTNGISSPESGAHDRRTCSGSSMKFLRPPRSSTGTSEISNCHPGSWRRPHPIDRIGLRPSGLVGHSVLYTLGPEGLNFRRWPKLPKMPNKIRSAPSGVLAIFS
jgi:hypothetical protein